MPQFHVKVELTATIDYEMDVEASSEREAEDKATGAWREKTPDDWQVNKGYISNWDVEAEQKTWECVMCDKEIPEDEYRRNDELCDACNVAEKEAEERRRQERLLERIERAEAKIQ